jgi:hypothetical protein
VSQSEKALQLSQLGFIVFPLEFELFPPDSWKILLDPDEPSPDPVFFTDCSTVYD